MNNLKLYALAVLDLGWITAFILSEIDAELRAIGVLVGIIVGILTGWNLKEQIQTSIENRRMKQVERKIKEIELEERLKKHYE